MSRKDHIVNVIKELIIAKVIPADAYAVGGRAATVIYNIRVVTDDIDVYVKRKHYTAYVQAGNEAAEDIFGEYAPYGDFIKIRPLSKEEFDRLPAGYEVSIVHPDKLLSDYEKILTTKDDSVDYNCTKAMVSDIKDFIKRYW